MKNINLSNRRLGVIKIDVEGAELLVLRGFANTLAEHNPFVIVETGHYYERFGYTFNDLLKFMKDRSYKPIYLLEDKIRPFSIKATPESGNIVFKKEL